MKHRWWLALSLGLNLVLLGALSLGAHRGLPSGVGTTAATGPDADSRVPSRPLRAETAPVAPEIVAVRAACHWSQIESSDYRVYIAHLRAMECPETTVRDIIVADVNEMYRGRVRALVNTVQNRFWDLMADQPSLEKMVNEKAGELQSLDKERDTLLRQLFGKGDEPGTWETEADDLERLHAREAQLDFLTPDKVQQCLALEDTLERERRELSERQPPLTADQRKEQLSALEEGRQRQLQQLLSPEEYAEYRLRRSSSAELRQRLAGFAATEEELKAVVELDAQQRDGKLSAAEKSKALGQLLGEERLAEYRRAQEGQFQDLYRFVNRLQLPRETATELYETRRTAETAVQQVRQRVDLTEAERSALLQQIRQETERSLSETLNPSTLEIYVKKQGDWLSKLEKLKP